MGVDLADQGALTVDEKGCQYEFGMEMVANDGLSTPSILREEQALPLWSTGVHGGR